MVKKKKKNTCQCRRHKRCLRHGFNLWVRKIPWRRARQRSPVFLPGESHGQRSLAGYSPQGHRESDTTEWLSRQAGIVSLLPTHFTVCVLSCFSHIQLFATLWTVAHQSPLFMGFSRQECWSELLCPPSKDLPHPGSSPGLSRLLHWQVGSLPLAPPGKPAFHVTLVLFYECFLVVMQVFRGSHCTRIVATYATMQ